MPSLCCMPRILFSQNSRFSIVLHSKKKPRFFLHAQSSSNSDDSVPLPLQSQSKYGPSEDVLRLQASSTSSRDAIIAEPKPRSWFGPNGQYIRELPCPSCRGRGYTPCVKCGGIERSRPDCSLCNGKGIQTCPQCLGERVIWEESIDEQPWERARSISPFKVKEDDEVDSLDIKLNAKRKSKRVYQSSAPEVNLKISRSLKSLNAKTGLFSKRMRIIHQDPTLHAQRVAAIKKVKGTAAARKHASEIMKAYFNDPENRRRRSVAMKGVKFFCSNCGLEGHRSFYCPELKKTSFDRRFRCGVCGERGHNRRTCLESNSMSNKSTGKRQQRCSTCRQTGHNSKTCPQGASKKQDKKSTKKCYPTSRRTYSCSLCQERGHNSRTCPHKGTHSPVPNA